MTLAQAVAAIEEKFLVLKKTEFRGETTLVVDREKIAEICSHAKQTGFDCLIDLSAVDNFGEEPRFEVVYELYSFTDNHYLRLKVAASEDDLQVPTVSGVWAGADWHEREAFDMMGIRFAGHPDMRRILMWDGYPYHPLRKDFPLAGKPSEVPEVAFTKAAPLEGGPFVTVPSTATSRDREPRSRQV
ncbi:MAG: NADH-quinone oxidoreductase subunit C [Verrucomicrobiota bacterium]